MSVRNNTQPRHDTEICSTTGRSAQNALQSYTRLPSRLKSKRSQSASLDVDIWIQPVTQSVRQSLTQHYILGQEK